MTDNTLLSLDTKLVQSPTVLSSDMGEEFVMMDIESGTYFNLKEVGAVVWNKLEAEISFGDLLNQLTDEFEIDRKTCEVEMRAFIQQMVDQKMVVLS